MMQNISGNAPQPELESTPIDDESLSNKETALKLAIMTKSQTFTRMTLQQLEESIDELVRLNIQ